jgi:hypothetical protein
MRDSDIILFMKIGRREHLQSMQNGILRFNPLEIYRVIENETHVKGRGDEYEGTLVITDINITLQRHDNGETITFHADSINYQNDAYSKLPILCLSYIDDQNLEVSLAVFAALISTRLHSLSAQAGSPMIARVILIPRE